MWCRSAVNFSVFLSLALVRTRSCGSRPFSRIITDPPGRRFADYRDTSPSLRQLDRADIVSALKSGGSDTAVADAMRVDVPTVPANTCLDQVFELLKSKPARFVAVLDPQRRLV